MTTYRKKLLRKRMIIFLITAIIIGGLFVYAFSAFADALTEEGLKNFDRPIMEAFISFISPKLTHVFMKITFFGSITWLVIGNLLVAAILSIRRHFLEAFLFVLFNALGGAFNWLLKYTFQRTRPDLHPLVNPGGYSFPSGHSMGSFIFYGLIAVFIYMYTKNTAVKTVLICVMGVVILLVGCSRIYLGAHYPSDVLAGFSAGGAWVTISTIILIVIRDFSLYKKDKKAIFDKK